MLLLTQRRQSSTDHYSSFTRLKRVTAWMFRFIDHCHLQERSHLTSYSTTEELIAAEIYWLLLSQSDHFAAEIEAIKEGGLLSNVSSLLSLHPFLDSLHLLHVGGRVQNSSMSYSTQHPVILHRKHPITRLIIHSEHLRLLHAGPTLLASLLGALFHVVGGHKVICSVTHACIACRRDSVKP